VMVAGAVRCSVSLIQKQANTSIHTTVRVDPGHRHRASYNIDTPLHHDSPLELGKGYRRMNTLTTCDSEVRDRLVAVVYAFPTVCGVDPAGAKSDKIDPIERGFEGNQRRKRRTCVGPGEVPIARIKFDQLLYQKPK
jgi:hypothetical protein